MNQIFKRYFHCFTSEFNIQTHWLYLLQTIIIAMNRDYNTTIKISSFFIFYNYKSEFFLDIIIDIKERKIPNTIERIQKFDILKTRFI